MTIAKSRTGPTDGPVVLTFFRFVIPSVFSLLAISTASVVDGFFVGNYLGTDALAAVNLLMPYFSLLFGFALMLAVGGSVKAGILIGRKEFSRASEIFSKTLICVFVLNTAAIPLGLLFSEQLFVALGATPELFPLMQSYFNILCVSMLVQLCTLVLYYFIRADNYPTTGMRALLCGAAVNIVLDALFIYVFEWGIQGAALATLLSQCVQLAIIVRYFWARDRHLSLLRPRGGWSELVRTAYNGFSEFINEISIGFVILAIHWIVNRQHGTDGIAAFSVINYLIYISLMVYYGIVDAMHGLLSQNFGAGLTRRVVKFMNLASGSIAVLGAAIVLCCFVWQSAIVEFFLEDTAAQAKGLAENFIRIVWPLFLFNGFNVLICSYLTSAEKAKHSSILALSRSFALPLLLAVTLDFIFSGNAFIYALPLGEGITFILAVVFILQFRPAVLARQIAV